jgi:4-hydroxy-3-polyprenylbenzoate decarboxylase
MSLAKYLFIAAQEDDPGLDPHHVEDLLRHVLERVDWAEDLHFLTRTTMDTLDYSGDGFNRGSKLIVAAAGPKRRELPAALPEGLRLPEGFGPARLVMPGVLAVGAPAHRAARGETDAAVRRFCEAIGPGDPLRSFPWITLVDDAEFAARRVVDWLWVTFTRSNPSADVDGVEAFTHQKHWGCRGPLVVDARIKGHHAPPLEEDPEVTRRVEALAAPGGPLHGLY